MVVLILVMVLMIPGDGIDDPCDGIGDGVVNYELNNLYNWMKSPKGAYMHRKPLTATML